MQLVRRNMLNICCYALSVGMKAKTESVNDDWTCRSVSSPTVFITGVLVRVLLREKYIPSVGSRVCV
jgi:hypothetical protein